MQTDRDGQIVGWIGGLGAASVGHVMRRFEHTWRVAETAVELHCLLPGWQVLSERELRIVEADSGELYASSVQVGRIADQPRLHRPDLVLVSPSARVVAVEVELSVKAASRLSEICRGWARARHIDRVYYLAASAPGGRCSGRVDVPFVVEVRDGGPSAMVTRSR